MLKEEIFTNALDGVRLKRIFLDFIPDGLTHYIREKSTGILYEDVVVPLYKNVDLFEEYSE